MNKITRPHELSHRLELSTIKNKIRMCFTKNVTEKSAIRKSLSIDKSQRTAFSDYLHRPFSVLLAGSKNSGKSTLLTQMKNSWDDSIPITETCEAHACVMRGLLAALQTFHNRALRAEEIAISTQVCKMIDLLSHEDLQNEAKVDDTEVQILWAGRDLQVFFWEERQFLKDSDLYFLDRLSNIVSPDYCPSSEDVFVAQIRSHGMYEWQTLLHGINVSIFDPSGLIGVDNMTGLPPKLMHCFEGIDMVVFVADLSLYDQPASKPEYWPELLDEYLPSDLTNIVIQYGTSLEDNMLRQTMSEFEDLSSEWFELKMKVVILNKYDLFERKFSAPTFSACFPEYTKAEKNSPHSAVRFLRRQFQNLGFQTRCYSSTLNDDGQAAGTLSRVMKPLERFSRLEDVLVHVGVL